MISLAFFSFILEVHNLHIFWDAVHGVQRAQTLEYERSEVKLWLGALN